MSKGGELRRPGIMTTIDATTIDLVNCKAGDFDIYNIAWGLGRTLRYGGHIREDYTVAMHSIVMSYLVPEEFAKEALLHDAAEAYTGDIIWPMKAVIPEVKKFEDRILNEIMIQYRVPTWTGTMSPVVKEFDERLMSHECFEMGIRPGMYDQYIEDVWLLSANAHIEWWGESMYAFLDRYYQLFGGGELDLPDVNKRWFPAKNPNGRPNDEERTPDATLDRFMKLLAEAEEEDSGKNAS